MPIKDKISFLMNFVRRYIDTFFFKLMGTLLFLGKCLRLRTHILPLIISYLKFYIIKVPILQNYRKLVFQIDIFNVWPSIIIQSENHSDLMKFTRWSWLREMRDDRYKPSERAAWLEVTGLRERLCTLPLFPHLDSFNHCSHVNKVSEIQIWLNTCFSVFLILFLFVLYLP